MNEIDALIMQTLRDDFESADTVQFWADKHELSSDVEILKTYIKEIRKVQFKLNQPIKILVDRIKSLGGFVEENK